MKTLLQMDAKTNQSRYYKAPAILLESTDINSTQKTLCIVVLSFILQGRRCYISNQALAKAIGLKAPRSAQRHIADLVSKGYLTSKIEGRHRFLQCGTKMVPLIDKFAAEPRQVSRGSYDRKASQITNKIDYDDFN